MARQALNLATTPVNDMRTVSRMIDRRQFFPYPIGLQKYLRRLGNAS